MILPQETFKKFNYYPENLTQGSNKKVCIKCSFCNNIYDFIYRNYIKVINSDNPTLSCRNCRSKKAKQTNLKKFGTENPSQLEEIKLKAKLTNLNKRGVEYSSQSLEHKEKVKKTIENKTLEEKIEIRKKVKNTLIKKYGVDNFSKTEQFKNKIKNKEKNEDKKQKFKKTCIEKYGVDNPFKSHEIKNKIKENNLKKYNCENPAQNKIIKERIKKTCIEKYGERHFNSLESTKQKKKQTNLKKYGKEYATQSDLVKQKTRNTLIEKGLIKIYNGKNILEWAENKGISRTHAGALLKSYGPDFLEKYEKNISDIELIIKNILIKHGINFEHQKIIEGRKSDFLIDNLVIECDSNYWHSDFNNTPKEYHFIKKMHYEKFGYKPLFFRSDEIIFKTEIVESIILNHLKLNKYKIGARKCEIRKVEPGNSQKFFEKNHLMSFGRGITYGLYDNETLVSAIQFYNKGKGVYEISRFCNLMGVTVSGGFSKILKYFELKYNPNKIITYIDCRYGFGQYLEDLGFSYKHTFLSFKWTNGRICFHRMKFPKNSGYDFNFGKIWDCGQAKFEKTF